jgi:HK97 family phage major capsid protein
VAFNNQINRSGAQALMPEDVASEIVQGVVEQSIIMQLGRRLPNMSRQQRRLPILSTLITAFFVSGDTGFKQTGQQQWANKFLNADELAVIVPIPELVLDDSEYDIWSEIKPRIAEAFGLAFDRAVLFGENRPSDWPPSLVSQAHQTTLANSSALSFDPSAASSVDLYEAILGQSGLVAAIEQVGFFPSAHVGALSLRGRLRGIRDAQGNPIFKSVLIDDPDKGVQGSTIYELDGSPLYFPRNGSMNSGGSNTSPSLMFAGDWSQLVWAIRTDITYKILDQAVITDSAGNVQFNLPQQDMVALRATLRLGWQLPNPINRIQTDETKRLPFAVLQS